MQSLLLSKKLLGALVAALLLPTVASATQLLKYSDHEPLGGMRTQFLKNVFFEEIEKESAGRLKIEAHWNSEITTGYKALATVGKTRLADIAVVVPEYSADTLPLHQIFKSFPVGPSGEKQVNFFRRTYAEIPEFTAELKKQNVVNLFSATGYPVAFFSDNPLHSLGEIKGTTWRSASFWHYDFLRNAGAKPVTIPWGEQVYKALQAKTLDGLMVNVDSGYLLKVHDIAPNVLVSKDLWLGHVYLIVMNEKTWEKLAQEDKEAINRAVKKTYQKLGAVMDSSFNQQIADIKKAGANIRLLTAQEVDQWKVNTQYQAVQADWVKTQETKGNTQAAPVMQKVTVLMNDVMK